MATSLSEGTRCFGDFHHAYIQQLRRVFYAPSYCNAPRGFASRERLAEQFQLSDPRQRVPLVPARRANIVFNFAEVLWYLAGRDDLEFISYYAPSMRRFSMDGQSLTGTAYGTKMLGSSSHDSQWDAVVAELSGDPDSKRAALQIFDGAELRVANNIDVSCTLGLQFLLRGGALHAVAYMRANDAYRGLVSDLFSFTFLQEVLATELGVELGSYTHTVGSMHVYASDETQVQAVLADPASDDEASFRFPAMPAENNWPALREVLELEEALRTNRHRLTSEHSHLGLPHYWTQILLLFEVYRRLSYDEPVSECLLGALDPIYQYLLRARWSARLPALERAS